MTIQLPYPDPVDEHHWSWNYDQVTGRRHGERWPASLNLLVLCYHATTYDPNGPSSWWYHEVTAGKVVLVRYVDDSTYLELTIWRTSRGRICSSVLRVLTEHARTRTIAGLQQFINTTEAPT